jgi:hypothetical protein
MRFNFGVALKRGSLRCSPENGNTFSLACFAALGFVPELFIVKEQLFTGGENKIRPAVNALQHPVLEFHRELLWPSAFANALPQTFMRMRFLVP